MRYFDPLKDTPEGELLQVVRTLEDVIKSKLCNMCGGYQEPCQCGLRGGMGGGMGGGLESILGGGMGGGDAAPPSRGMPSAADFQPNRGDEPMPDLPAPKGDSPMEEKPPKGKKSKKEKDDKGDKKKSKKDDKKKSKKEKDDKGESEEGNGDGAEEKKPSPFDKGDATSEFLRERGILVKYEQESSVDNQVPELMEVSGSAQIRATGYSTNQRIPFMTDGDSRKPISEVFKMPSVAQTGYDAKSSSLHMHLNDGGGVADNIAIVEEKLTQLKKQAPVGNEGILSEIAGLVEEVFARL